MVVSMIGQKRLVIVGATGTGAASRQVFENRDIRVLVQSLEPLRGSQRKSANDTTPNPQAV